VRKAIKSLNNNKSPGVDNTPSKLIKYGGPQLAKAVTDLIKEIWTTEKMLNQWRTSIQSTKKETS